MFNPDKFTEICCKYDITPNQFYILYLTWRKDWDNLYKYIETVNKFKVEDLSPLVEKGYLKHWGSEKFEILDLAVTEEFSKMLFVDTFEAGEELYKTYPHWLDIGGKKVISTKGDKIDGKYYGKDQLVQEYGKRIGNDIVKHKWILEKIEIAKDRNLINITIRDFILNEMWEAFKDLDDDSNTPKIEIHGIN